jgi:hypothetical protein
MVTEEPVGTVDAARKSGFAGGQPWRGLVDNELSRQAE